MSYKGQENLFGWPLTFEERTWFYPKVVKIKNYYKKCHKKGCDNNVVNKKNRFYCATHYQELLDTVKPFSEPLLLMLVLDLK